MTTSKISLQSAIDWSTIFGSSFEMRYAGAHRFLQGLDEFFELLI